MYYLINVTQT